MNNELKELLDKQAITELSYRYSRACDRLDRELLSSVYWLDGTDDHGVFKGDAPAYIDWVMDFLAGWISTHHDNSNILIDLNGDAATGEVHWVGYYRFETAGVVQDHIGVGRYIDRYERREDEWRIKHRTCLSDWSRTEPANLPLPDATNPLIGKRGPTDLVYARETIGLTT